jgi:hypothetical protein
VDGAKPRSYIHAIKLKYMKQKHELDFSIPLIAIIILIAVLASSCSINITPHQAANGKAKCGRGLR